ncbi:unnamed protein product [Paramecium sonneborni]|uniref:Uncharacterized protein n=1 Tax=Paramecium sonneborni TaxID=65129 RepID=A0A8S1R418_9CILI|nr:unnamed protein product [Paramecium sonneborni]
MIEVTFIVNQLSIQQTQSVYLDQRIDFHIRHILYQASVDLYNWENIQCSIIYSNVKYGCDKTFEELNITNNSKLSIKFTKPISIEILNQQFASIQYQADAFDRIKMFQEWIIKNHLRNAQYEIQIIDASNGKSIQDETWIQNGIQQSIQVLLNINVKQSILWQGNSITIEFNVFSPISQLIQSLKNQLKINTIISLQYQDNNLKPEILYFNQNIPLNIQLQANIPNALTYRISFQKQQREKQITCNSYSFVSEIIRQLRSQFQINKSSNILLKYYWILDTKNTFAQEDIPNFSLIELIEEDSQGEFQITLRNIGENVDQQQNDIICLVRIDTTLKQLSQRIPHQINEEVKFYLDQNAQQQLDDQQNMENLDVCYGMTIMYKIERRPRITQIYKQIEQKKFGILIVNMNSVTTQELAIQNDVFALASIMRHNFGLPKNQIIKFSIGTTLLKDEDNLDKILDGKFDNLQAIFLETINIYLKYLHNDSKTLITVKLEDTLEKISKEQNLNGIFKINDKSLSINETFAQLQIYNGETIIYEKTTPIEEESEKIPSINNDPISQNQQLHQPSPINSGIQESNDQQKELPVAKPQNVQSKIENIIKEEDFINVNTQVGGRVYKFRAKGTQRFEVLKSILYDFLIKEEPERIKYYSLVNEEQVLRDDILISSLNKQEINIQLKLKQNII